MQGCWVGVYWGICPTCHSYLGCGTSSDLLTRSLREAWEPVFSFVPWVVPHLSEWHTSSFCGGNGCSCSNSQCPPLPFPLVKAASLQPLCLAEPHQSHSPLLLSAFFVCHCDTLLSHHGCNSVAAPAPFRAEPPSAGMSCRLSPWEVGLRNRRPRRFQRYVVKWHLLLTEQQMQWHQVSKSQTRLVLLCVAPYVCCLKLVTELLNYECRSQKNYSWN